MQNQAPGFFSALGMCLGMFLLGACSSISEPKTTNSAVHAEAPESTSKQNAAPLRWVHRATHDYEKESPGAGFSRRFECEAGWADVYVYDGGYKGWVDGVGDPNLEPMFKEIIKGVQQVFGKEEPVKLVASETIIIGGIPFRHAVLYVTQKGKQEESHVYLTAQNHRILKFRISFYQRNDRRAIESLTTFIVQQLAFTKNDSLQSAAIAAPKEQSIAINYDPTFPNAKTAALWLAYLLSRAEYREKNSIPLPATLGTIEAGFEEEVYARDHTLVIYRELKEKDPSISDTYWETLQRIRDNDMLREYVWVNFYQPSWNQTKEPERLEAFRAWSSTNLPEHKPQTHGSLSVVEKAPGNQTQQAAKY